MLVITRGYHWPTNISGDVVETLHWSIYMKWWIRWEHCSMGHSTTNQKTDVALGLRPDGNRHVKFQTLCIVLHVVINALTWRLNKMSVWSDVPFGFCRALNTDASSYPRVCVPFNFGLGGVASCGTFCHFVYIIVYMSFFEGIYGELLIQFCTMSFVFNDFVCSPLLQSKAELDTNQAGMNWSVFMASPPIPIKMRKLRKPTKSPIKVFFENLGITKNHIKAFWNFSMFFLDT